MKFFSFAFLFSVVFSLGVGAQNLVPNPGFEREVSQEDIEPWHPAEDWECSTCLIYTTNNSRPWASESIIKAHSGSSYVGIALGGLRNNAYRCFLYSELQQPLKKDEEYRVGFYLISDKRCDQGVTSIGANFSTEKITNDSLLKIKNPTLEYSPGYDLYDPQNWMLVSIPYKAKGNEKYLAIGNFNDTSNASVPDSLRDLDKKIGYTLEPSGIRNQGAFYFIDDVFVIPAKESVSDISKIKFKKGESVNLYNLFFETDKAELLPASFAELDKLTTILENNPSLTIVIRGHTDNAGTEEHNQQLSLERANAVMNYFIKKGIAANRLSTWGFGSTRPLASNITEEGRAINRRVEILVK